MLKCWNILARPPGHRSFPIVKVARHFRHDLIDGESVGIIFAHRREGYLARFLPYFLFSTIGSRSCTPLSRFSIEAFCLCAAPYWSPLAADWTQRTYSRLPACAAAWGRWLCDRRAQPLWRRGSRIIEAPCRDAVGGYSKSNRAPSCLHRTCTKPAPNLLRLQKGRYILRSHNGSRC